MNSLENIIVDTDSEEDNEAETSKYLSFSMVILKTTILIAERFFSLCQQLHLHGYSTKENLIS